MQIDFVALNEHLRSYNELVNKARHTKEDERRMAFLQTAISALKAGATLEQVDESRKQSIASKYGVRVDAQPTDREIEARGWQSFVEQRDMSEGNPISRIGTYTGLGYFVPTGFWPQTFAAMAKADALFDENSVTMLKTDTGNPVTVPVIGDIENVATEVAEAGSQTSTDISSTGQAVLGAYSFKTPRQAFSIEAFQDMDTAVSAIELFKSVNASRLARGIAKRLVSGNGTNQTLGLVQSLVTLGVSNVVAAGSAANTGGSETGANSLGSKDFANALANIDQAYIDSPKAAWFMNRSTLINVASIVNKFGNSLNLVQYVGGQPYIYGVPVKICPSMDNIGVSNIPVVLGDGTYWCTRLVNDENSGIRVYQEASGLVEYGKVGLSVFMRADGVLLYNDTSSPAPFTFIRNHS
jgi:HK97 family phage major capsid protein